MIWRSTEDHMQRIMIHTSELGIVFTRHHRLLLRE